MVLRRLPMVLLRRRMELRRLPMVRRHLNSDADECHYQNQRLMLLNDLYTIEKWAAADTTAGEVRAVLVLDAAHPIFAGHFPGQPVVPGACQLQMVEELLSHVLNREFRLVSANQIKFLTPIDPRRHPRIDAVLQYALDGPFQVSATLGVPDTAFLKLNGIYGAE
jgi:3-hydroxyacyl-[acyl-carrier-protein] dehydratase